MRLYEIGPVTSVPEDNLPAFREAMEKLIDAGYEVDMPHDFIPADMPHENAMLMSISALTGLGYDQGGRMWRMYDGVALLPGWEQSEGARLEHQVAEACGIPVKTVDEWIEEAKWTADASSGDCYGGGYVLVAQECIRCRKFIRPVNREVAAEDVKYLRERTGAGLRECREALQLYGFLDIAEEYLRCAGSAVITKCGRFEPADPTDRKEEL